MELEVRHLRALLAVADHGSVTKAAAALGVSQPSLSSQIRRIERVIGAPLFERSHAGVVPTEHGRTVLAKARMVVAEMADLHVQNVTAEDSSRPIELRMGSMPGPLLSTVIPQISRLVGNARGLRVHSHTDASATTLLRMVQTRRLDAAFVADIVGFETPTPDGVRREVLVPIEPVFVGLSERHPLAGNEIINLSELADEQWLADPNDDLGGTAYLRKACRDAGFEPAITSEVSDGATARAFVGSGRYVALFQATAPEGFGVVIRPLLGDPIVQRHELVWTDRCPIAPALLRRAAMDGYLELIDRNTSYYRWWAEHQ